MLIINAFSTIIALLATVPIITFIVIFFIMKKITNQATKSTKMAADLSAFFFLFAVVSLLNMIFDRNFFLIVLMIYMVMTLIILIFQWRKELEIRVWHAIRIVWRIGFVIMAALYILLLPIGIYLNY